MEVFTEGALPKPQVEGGSPIQTVLSTRRSVREFKNTPLNRSQLSQLLWAGQGITSEKGFRTTPSAGATFPLEIRIVSRFGVFSYSPQNHSLARISKNNQLPSLTRAALAQESIAQSAVSIVVGGIETRTSGKYGSRAFRYMVIEAGAAAQNMLLQATSLGLGAVLVGAFDDNEVHHLAGFPKDARPLIILAIGHSK